MSDFVVFFCLWFPFFFDVVWFVLNAIRVIELEYYFVLFVVVVIAVKFFLNIAGGWLAGWCWVGNLIWNCKLSLTRALESLLSL